MNIYPGQVWRKRGPCGWLRVEQVLIPGEPGYDGGLPGVWVTFGTYRGAFPRLRQEFLAASSCAAFVTDMANHSRYPLDKARACGEEVAA